MQLFNIESEQCADMLSDQSVRVLQTLDYPGGLRVNVVEGGKSYGDCLVISGTGDHHIVIQTNMNDECGGSIHDNIRALERAA